jgi:uncharacterized repeat protein (TIGR04076 family)
MKKCRITVLATTFNEEIAREYGVESLGPCPFYQVGQVFEVDYEKPEGFCAEAWHAIHHYVFAMAHGAVGPFAGNYWIQRGEVTINSCNDGLRPVVFRIERIAS